MAIKEKLQVQALTIAGFDSGGGAGLQADLKVFQELFVYGTSVLTALPIQNTLGVKGVFDIPLSAIEQQLAVVFEDFKLQAVKTGMLFTSEIIHLVANYIKQFEFGPLVVDPVMIAKSGQKLLLDSAIESMITELLPQANVITPNIPEAEVLLNRPINTKGEIVQAAFDLQKIGVDNVVIKGGHSQDNLHSDDLLLLADGKLHWLKSERFDTKNTHGTGCTFSACITAELAKGKSVYEAVIFAKKYIQLAISHPIAVGCGHGPTNHFAYRQESLNERD
ncbi:MAG: bifunctional hydroxymethylpyrimidine kinase/phosphomethylpyrimidine kinase [Streptococcaceae bacterium]|jgi:hydroxymethylpyrimidine/phosphomethylpyrimidine kinase|nr:bifunctional hydroxymethylpyrimidine kinase/phosphomethylpyrimidine kinase [Streptococcaceae bacterium]